MQQQTSENAPTTAPTRSLPMGVVVLAFAILIGFLALILWGLNRSYQGPIQIGDKVPAFIFTSFEGQEYKTTDLVGKVIVVNFWASWCKPCEQEAADMQSAWKYYQSQANGQVVFMGVDWVDTEPEAKGYINKFGITYLNGPDLRTSISQLFRIKGVPETYILSRDGKLANVKIGPFVSVDEIRSVIDPLLAK
jgi:cytochrome c biogenesis protein CcmG/thiol:disulfide interchange protein DsbE